MKYMHHSSLTLLSNTLSYASPQLTVKTRIEAYSCKDVKKERRMRKKKEEEWMSELEEIEELSISPELKDPLLVTPFGPLSSRSSRALHFLLTSTLNVAYPDYDFTSVRPEEFKREPGGVSGVLGGLSGVLNDGGIPGGGIGSSPRSFGSYPVGGGVGFAPPLQQVEGGGLGTSLPAGTGAGYGSGSASGSSLLVPSRGSVPLLSSAQITHPTLHRILNDVIDLNECIVFSYIPSAEADPHADVDDESEGGDADGMHGEGGEDLDGNGAVMEYGYAGPGDEDDDGGMMMTMDDLDEDGSTHQHVKARRSSNALEMFPGESRGGWPSAGAQTHQSGGQHPSSSYEVQGHGLPASLAKDSGYGSSWGEVPVTPNAGSGSRSGNSGGLLWSANYFLYCRRQRRILFISVWARKKELTMSPHSHDLDPLPIGRSPSGVHSSFPGSFTKSVGLNMQPMPSLDGLALELTRSENERSTAGSSKANPISIGGSPASVSTVATAVGPIDFASGNLPGLIPPPTHPKLRRERSESTASVHSTLSAGNDRLKDLAGIAPSRKRANKRVKV